MGSWTVRGYTEGPELGRGASGRVVEAVGAGGRRVAIKYLSAKLVGDPAYMALFREEARLLTELEVPQVVRLFAYVEEPGLGAAIVMELVEGASLHEMISRQGPTGPESALAVLKGSLLGLAAAHSLGIVHRDYKPENVLVDATGQSKLADFGVAVRAGRRAPAAGTPLYMAPEQWAGAPASPATDIYAATAVFYECLTGRTPFSGRLGQLCTQHEHAAVPSADVDVPLRPLVERGMAKDPGARPAHAAMFVAELEATATAAYGPDWERRGRAQLAARAAALLLLLVGRGPVPGSAPNTDAVSWFFRPKVWGRRRRRAVTAVAAAVVVVGAVAITAAALASQRTPTRVSDIGLSKQGGGPVIPLAKEMVLASASASPPAAAGSCKTPTAFTYSATLTASRPGPVTYRWVYSSGTPSGTPSGTNGQPPTGPVTMGPPQTVQFAAAGSQVVSGLIRTRTAGAGWVKLEVTSPISAVSNWARYLLVCAAGGQSGNVTATATVVPAASTITCGSASPNFTFTGTVTSSKAGPVTYYWALGDGATTTPATLLFKAAGTMSVQQLPLTPPTEGTGTAAIVVTSPEASVSNTATFTLSCQGHGNGHGGGTTHLSLLASAKVTPPSSTVGCTSGPSTFSLTGTITANEATTVTYYWALSGGDGQSQTLTFAGPGTEAVVPDQVTPPSPDAYTGAGEIIIVSPTTSPPTPPSNEVTFTQSCTSSLQVTTNSLPPATQNASYTATLSAAGGKPPYTWTARDLPAGLTMSPSGMISGITSAPPGNYTVTATVADGETATVRTASASTPTAQTASASFTLTVKPATVKPATLTVQTISLPAGTQNVAYTPLQVQATGGDGGNTWAAAGLPDGMNIDPATGVISGAPGKAGNYTVTVTVTDAAGATASSPPLPLTIAYPTLTIKTTGLPPTYRAASYSATVSATGGDGDYSWSATGLPQDLSINPTTGVISGGLEEEVGTYTVDVTVTDGEPAPQTQTASEQFNLVIYPPIDITTTQSDLDDAGFDYLCTDGGGSSQAPCPTYQMAAVGGSGSYTWSVGALPPGVTLSASGQLTDAIPSTDIGCDYTVQITATDNADQESTSETYTMEGEDCSY
jgi:eukaryotic-like serine/threonine-protein kinase